MNTLIVIGWLGVKECYVNIPLEEAIRRYMIEQGNEEPTPNMIKEYKFTDHFGAYDVWV